MLLPLEVFVARIRLADIVITKSAGASVAFSYTTVLMHLILRALHPSGLNTYIIQTLQL